MGTETVQSSVVHQPERRHRRFSLRYPVLVKFDSQDSTEELQAVSENVSVGGMLLVAPSAVPQFSSVTFTLTVQGEQVIRPIQLVGEGRVVRVESSREGGHFAIAVECVRPITELEYLAAS